MKLELAESLEVGDIIKNTKSGVNFEITRVITDSRCSPEYVTKSLKDGNECGGTFFTWLMGEDWIKI